MPKGQRTLPVRPSRSDRRPSDANNGAGVCPAGSAPPRPPANGLSRKNDSSACHCVRPSIVVTERNAEPPANIGEFRRTDCPLRAGKVHGADEPRTGRPQSVAGAASVQDATVERSVVGGDEGSVGEPSPECRPQLGEGRRVAYVLPTQAVKASERKLPDGWPDEVGPRENDPTCAGGGDTDSASAVSAGRGGLEIDGNERVQGFGCDSRSTRGVDTQVRRVVNRGTVPHGGVGKIRRVIGSHASS